MPMTAMHVNADPPRWKRFKHMVPKLTAASRPTSKCFAVGTHPFLEEAVNAMAAVFREYAKTNDKLAAVLDATAAASKKYRWPATDTSTSLWPAVTVIATPLTNDPKVDVSCDYHTDV